MRLSSFPSNFLSVATDLLCRISCSHLSLLPAVYTSELGSMEVAPKGCFMALIERVGHGLEGRPLRWARV
jgi:hypothetical protein